MTSWFSCVCVASVSCDVTSVTMTSVRLTVQRERNISEPFEIESLNPIVQTAGVRFILDEHTRHVHPLPCGQIGEEKGNKTVSQFFPGCFNVLVL